MSDVYSVRHFVVANNDQFSSARHPCDCSCQPCVREAAWMHQKLVHWPEKVVRFSEDKTTDVATANQMDVDMEGEADPELMEH